MKQITVTSPLLPPLEELIPHLEQIWKSKRITNEGSYHAALEEAIKEYMKVPYVSLFTNGTIALSCALQALDITGEVITTPYSFVATTHALRMNGIQPVFVDIDPISFNLDPSKIEKAITSQTRAILPVHIYGNPCKLKEIKDIADKYGLKVIYDAAHTFGVEYENQSLAMAGDLAVLSLNATKVYNTIEGGIVVSHDPEMKKKIDLIRSFGFVTESEIALPGTNGKMDEVRSAYGLVGLKYVKDAIECRSRVAAYYRKALRNIKGIIYQEDMENVKPNYSYFPILVETEKFKWNRDELDNQMKENNILCRRYFYPLISSFTPYRELPSANPGNLPVAHSISDSVLCLPIHHALSEEDLERVVSIII